jgi:hypothetical protein
MDIAAVLEEQAILAVLAGVGFREIDDLEIVINGATMLVDRSKKV